MKISCKPSMWLAVTAVVMGVVTTASAQTFKMTTPVAPGVAVPDRIESSIGTLDLSYGYPSAGTVAKIYDNLDRSRALQAYLMAIPIVNQAGMRDSLRKFGPDNQTDVIWEDLVDPRTVELTANDNTIYNFIWIDSRKGPLVLEVPPAVLGGINDFWYRWVGDVGITGEDRGKGGKYLVLPPAWQGEVPSFIRIDEFTSPPPHSRPGWLILVSPPQQAMAFSLRLHSSSR